MFALEGDVPSQNGVGNREQYQSCYSEFVIDGIGALFGLFLRVRLILDNFVKLNEESQTRQVFVLRIPIRPGGGGSGGVKNSQKQAQPLS